MKKYCFNKDWTVRKVGEAEAKSIELPHDAMILETRDPNSLGGSAVGYFPGGVYEYEKKFHVPQEWESKHVTMQFEGVYKDAKVYINGKEAGGRPNGYLPFFIEIDGLLSYGQINTIRVVADNSDMPNSRWYTGAGIYRPVWLWVGSPSFINIEGIKITTLSYNPARILVETSFVGEGEVAVEISYNGKMVCKASGANVQLDIPNAHLWSDETPELYECNVTLEKNGTTIDEACETFGIRMVEWGVKGLFINGKETLLRGGCVHHDNGILGARSYEKSEERRVRIMKQAGYNAIRSSHNPAAKAMLKAL